MPSEPAPIAYSRCGFSTELPAALRFTKTHFWVGPTRQPDLWRVGFTAFAARVLGELVELGFEVAPGATLVTGQKIGWYEGFKAMTDLYAVGAGRFGRANPELELNGDWIKTDSYGRGWLYELQGQLPAELLSAAQYVPVLDAAIDLLS